jgi:LPXTG-motif cell wall-anchored protein
MSLGRGRAVSFTRMLLVAGIAWFCFGAAGVHAASTYTIDASATSMGPGESIVFSTNAPADQYAQVFVTYIDGSLSQVAYGPASRIVGTIAWEDWVSTNWYTCTGGTMAVVVYTTTVTEAGRDFTGSLFYGQTIGATAPDAEVRVELEPSTDPNRCGNTSGQVTTSTIANSSEGQATTSTIANGSEGQATTSTIANGSEGQATTSTFGNATAAGNQLPTTGATTSTQLGIAVASVLFGAALILAARRRVFAGQSPEDRQM